MWSGKRQIVEATLMTISHHFQYHWCIMRHLCIKWYRHNLLCSLSGKSAWVVYTIQTIIQSGRKCARVLSHNLISRVSTSTVFSSVPTHALLKPSQASVHQRAWHHSWNSSILMFAPQAPRWTCRKHLGNLTNHSSLHLSFSLAALSLPQQAHWNVKLIPFEDMQREWA